MILISTIFMGIKKEDFIFIVIVHPFLVAYFYLGCFLVIYCFFFIFILVVIDVARV